MKNEKDNGLSIKSLHDEVIKNFLTENETAKSFFQEYLPPEIARNLDFDTLKIYKDTFVDKKLSKYFSDMLYHINLNNRDAFIYLLIEHKSWEELRESVTQILTEGGDLMATIADRWVEKGILKGREEGILKGREEGIEKVTRDIVKKSLKEGIPIETIMRITGLSTEKIKKIEENMNLS